MQPMRWPEPQLSLGVPTIFGRWFGRPMFAWSGAIITLKGTPDCAVKIPLACQLPSVQRRNELL